MSKVVLKFQPDVIPLPGHFHRISIPDPLKPSERFIPDIEVREDGGFYVELPMHIARIILASDSHIWKLWSPYKLVVPMGGSHGAGEVETLTSIDPTAGAKAMQADATPPSATSSTPPAPPAATATGKASKAKASPKDSPKGNPAADPVSEVDRLLSGDAEI